MFVEEMISDEVGNQYFIVAVPSRQNFLFNPFLKRYVNNNCEFLLTEDVPKINFRDSSIFVVNQELPMHDLYIRGKGRGWYVWHKEWKKYITVREMTEMNEEDIPKISKVRLLGYWRVL